MPFRFGSPEHDVHLLREVLDVKPFSQPVMKAAWEDVSASLNDMGMAVTYLTCRDRTLKLINKPGSEADLDGEKEQLLQQVREDYLQGLALREEKKGKRAREAFNNVTTVTSFYPSPSTLTWDTDASTMGSPSPSPSKRRVGVSYYETKNRREEEKLSLKKEALALKREQLAFQRDLFKAEREERERRDERDRKEREERMIADREEKHEMREMIMQLVKKYRH
ncbi:unnamed protein product [Darwinula stevensoni]|uniref:Uncharacterized protein n=1 Tax=Darwinula stevensoni TaxID=69355 RepID=A0A7R9AG66_9CRUS|nr:unnamed protein product [Darwinula stevensoni]CAG0903614.1 unnamed protein product [Darwinula stevensoni]